MSNCPCCSQLLYINRMAEKLTSSFNINGKDFEKEASEIKNKIQTYFSQLIVTIKNRQIKLITEVNEILSGYRKEKDRVKKKMRELEEMKRYHEELYSTSTFKNLQDDILKRIKTELAAMNQETMDSMVIEFEWNKKFVTEAKELGTLETYSIFSLCTNEPPANELHYSYQNRVSDSDYNQNSTSEMGILISSDDDEIDNMDIFTKHNPFNNLTK